MLCDILANQRTIDLGLVGGSGMAANGYQHQSSQQWDQQASERDHYTHLNAMAPATERGRFLTAPPSLPLKTIHMPFGVRPVMMPT
jgi:hypothetical protein